MARKKTDQETIDREQEFAALQSDDNAQLSGEKVKVKFFNGPGEDGRDSIPIGHNGKVWLVKREEVVELPVEVLRGMDDSVVTMYGANGEARDVPRFPYQIVR